MEADHGSQFVKQHEGELEASSSSTYELQHNLVQAALSVDNCGGVQSSFSLVSPTSAVCQVIISGAFGGGFSAGGAASSGSGASEAVSAPKEDEKKKED